METEHGCTNTSTSAMRTSYNSFTRNPYIIIIQIVFLVTGVTLNTVTILIIVRGKKFGGKLKIQLTNLAVADFMSSIFAFGASSVKEFIVLPYPDNEVLCKMHLYLGYSIYCTSLLCNASIACERFVAVYFPFLSARYTRNQIISVAVSTWILGLMFNINVLFDAGLFENPVLAGQHICFMTYRPMLSTAVRLTFAILQLLLPATVILGLYFLIALKVCRRKPIGNKTLKHSSTRNKVLLTVAADGIIAVATYLPFFTYVFVSVRESRAGIEPDFLSDVIGAVLYELIHTNCFLTPIIYLCLHPDFKKEGKKALQSLKDSRSTKTSTLRHQKITEEMRKY
ncbi:somatostatin receptor type 2-like [Watersipora subatra]|uniref:somatostatin receptor type 2-like n=1 Tax=Watersipora subatra TaxID=2589382 RepID=UPI00355AE67D